MRVTAREGEKCQHTYNLLSKNPQRLMGSRMAENNFICSYRIVNVIYMGVPVGDDEAIIQTDRWLLR
jgi:hypothetical protein